MRRLRGEGGGGQRSASFRFGSVRFGAVCWARGGRASERQRFFGATWRALSVASSGAIDASTTRLLYRMVDTPVHEAQQDEQRGASIRARMGQYVARASDTATARE